jgi:hypothetical protein
MATTCTDKSEAGNLLVLEWTLTASENGDAKRIGSFGDKSYAMWGTFGGTVTIQGSWDAGDTPASNSWLTLHETDNTTEIALTSDGCGVILENPVWMRPVAGASVSSVKVVISAPWRKSH